MPSAYQAELPRRGIQLRAPEILTAGSLLLLLGLGPPGCAGGGGHDDDDDGGTEEVEPPSMGQADVLFVVRDSENMGEPMEALIRAFEDFAEVAGSEAQVAFVDDVPREDLGGDLLGAPIAVHNGVAAIQSQLACRGTCWDEVDVPSDSSYTCGDPVGDQVSQEWLECRCEVDWEEAGSCVSPQGSSEPLEAALLALCRASDSDPGVCAHSSSDWDSSWLGSNAGLLRGGPLHIVVFSDMGDTSDRIGAWEDDSAVYAEAFDALAPDGWTLHLMGTAWNSDTSGFYCQVDAIHEYMTDRLVNLVDLSGGVRANLYDEDNGCALGDVAGFLDEVAENGS